MCAVCRLLHDRIFAQRLPSRREWMRARRVLQPGGVAAVFVGSNASPQHLAHDGESRDARAADAEQLSVSVFENAMRSGAWVFSSVL